MGKVTDLVHTSIHIIKKALKDPSLIRKNLNRKIVNRLFTSQLKMDKYDIMVNPTSFSVLEFPEYEKPTVSIIIPVYNKWEYTYSCLVTLLRNTEGVTYEVIIGDDQSSDETMNAAKYLKNVKIIRHKENQRFVKNCNRSAEHAKGKYIVLLNNDVNIQTDWLASMVRLAESNEAIGVVGSKLIYPDGRLQEAGGLMHSDGVPENFGSLENPHKHDYNYVREVDYVTGASILVRHDLWKKLGGFDEDFSPGYYEETDFCYRTREAGYKVMYQPLSRIIHYEGITHGRDTKVSFKAYQLVNKERFFNKWKKVLKAEQIKHGENSFKAKDRAINKKTIVVIDSRVPLYDQEAGSRSTFAYLKLFIEMGLHVKFIANSITRYEPYTTELEQLGIEVLYASADNAKKWIKDNGQFFDYVYLHRPDIALEYLEYVRKHSSAKIWYQTHDLHYLREKRRGEIEKDDAALKKSEYYKKIELKICRLVDIVLTFSEYEKEIIQKEFNVTKVYTVPLYIYDSFSKPITIDEAKNRSGLLFVGGFGHFPNRDGILWFTEKIFPKLLEKQPKLQLTIVGSNPPTEVTSLKSDSISVLSNISDADLKRLHNETKVLIVPLRYGAGIKGKVVDALAQGVPMVSTSIGIEGLPNIERVITPADSEENFVNRITDLISDTEGYTLVSQTYIKYAELHFSLDTVRTIFTKIF